VACVWSPSALGPEPSSLLSPCLAQYQSLCPSVQRRPQQGRADQNTHKHSSVLFMGAWREKRTAHTQSGGTPGRWGRDIPMLLLQSNLSSLFFD
jgi:hypothetical protein